MTRLTREVFSGDSLTETLAFRTNTGADFVPTVLEYRAINLQTGLQIVDWTTIASPAADMTVLFPGTLFASEDLSETSEVHELTVRVNRGEAATVAKQSIVYDVTVTRSGELPA